MKKNSLLLIFALFTFQVLAGGGWTPGKGKGFYMVSQRMIGGGFIANNAGLIGQAPTASILTTNLYAEYGITNRLCGIVYSPVLTIANQSAGIDDFGSVYLADNAAGVGDIDVAVKYRLLDGKYPVSVSGWLGLNTGDFTAGNTGLLHLGDGEFSQMIRFDMSHAFKSFWWTVYAGFNNRTQNFSDEIRFGGEFGWLKSKFGAILKVDNRTSLFNGTAAPARYYGIYSNDLEYFGVSPQLMYKFANNIGITAEAGFALHARNIIAAPSLSLGVFYDLK